MITVLLVDDHPVIQQDLRGMLAAGSDLEVIGETGSGREGISLAAELRPDVVLVDLRRRLTGPGGTAQVLAAARSTRVMILADFDTDHDVLLATGAGAYGYLPKGAFPEELAEAVRAAARGETLLTDVPEPARPVERPAPVALSAREAEVLRLVAQGHTNASIAQNLYLSQATVKTYLLRIFGKLGVSDRTAAVTTAMSRDLI